MKFKNYIMEKTLKSTMVGFGINNNDIKRQIDYIESWLIRYKINYDEIENKHISMAMIKDVVDKSELIRFINEISNENLKFKMKDYTILEGRDWDFIVVELKRNPLFLKIFELVDSKYDIVKFKDFIRPHTSLFKIKKGDVSMEFFNEIIENAPKLKEIKPKKIELWNNKFNIEFIKRMK